MIRRTSNEFGSKSILQLFPEACNELGPSIRNNGLRDTMQSNNLIKVDFGILLGRISGMHWKKMSSFGQSINDYPYGVMFLEFVGKTHYKIHTNVFPLPRWDG
jgi:hypothetical protein